MLQIGKMYLVKEYFWFLYPTKELAAAGTWAHRGRQRAAEDAKWFSESYNCNVFVVETNTCFVLLEVDEAERFYNLLDSNGNIGWIYCPDFSQYFELVKE